MEIQQLRHLLAAAYAPSYAQAAKDCFTSRQNIAHSIKSIENELNVTLFEREGNMMVLTPAGKKAVRQANEIVAKVDGLRVMFFDSDMHIMMLNLAVSTNLFAGIPSSADELLAEYPGGIRMFEMDCDESYQRVCSEKVDAALIMCMERTFPECNALEIARSKAYALTSSSSPLAQKPQISITDLEDQKILIMSEPDFQYEPLFEQLDSIGYSRDDVSVITSTSSMVHLVKRSQVVSIVSDKFASHPPEGIAAIPFSDSQLDWHFYMLYQMRSSGYHMIMKLAEDVRDLFDLDGGCGTIVRSF